MRIRVLNLDRSLDRLAEFRARNCHLPGIERVGAVDGRSLDRNRLLAEGWIAPDLDYTPGALGNALSHMLQWREAAAGDAPVTVLEDDAVLCGNFAEEAARITRELGADWDFVQWGYNFDTVLVYDLMPGVSHCTALFEQARMREVLPSWRLWTVRSHVHGLIRSLGIPAYTVSPRGAARLLAFCRPLRALDTEFPLLGMRRNYSIDFMLNGAYADLRAHVAVPALALVANDWTRSTVQDAADASGPANPAVVELPGDPSARR